MRGRRSTVVVFVVVAVMWLVVFYSTWIAYRHSYQQLEDSGSTEPSFVVESLYYVLLVVVSPIELTVSAYRSLSNQTMGDWFVGDSIFAGLAINAVAWSTIFTTAFVLVRRLRDRRAASKAM